jgi:hypothetical protein
MEQAIKTDTSGQTKTSLQNRPNNSGVSTASTPPEFELALLALINRSRALNGWGMRTLNDLEEEITVWYRKFAEYNVPINAYPELFDLAFKYRAVQISRGEKPLPMDATLLVAQWIGENGLRKQMRQRDIDARNLLPATAESQCRRCLGLGKEYLYGQKGDVLGVLPSCDHRPLVESEYLFKVAEQERNAKPIEIKPTDAVDAVLANKRPSFRPPPETAEEIIIRAYDEVKHEYLRAVGDLAKQGWLAAATMLIHAQDYVRKNK